MKPIYTPSGKAKEYGDYAINIYTGCPHRCYYCFAPSVLRKDREDFHSHIEPRKGIVEAVKKQLESEKITDKLIHLCFTCDPYPRGYDCDATREIIRAIKATGNHVQILTKNGEYAESDFDLLDGNDWFGVTITGSRPGWEWAIEPPFIDTVTGRTNALTEAHRLGVKTWVSYEPVLNVRYVIDHIKSTPWVDKIKIGKLNYHESNINWHDFGITIEAICKDLGRNYYIKESLRNEMK